jgi:hypothetical protein
MSYGVRLTEEKFVHLRLVAGTEVSKLQREQLRSVEQATQDAASGTQMAQMQEQARELIGRLKPGLDGLSVSELLAESNHLFEYGKPSIALTQRHGDIRAALHSIGIHIHSALPEDELDVHVYGLVIEPKELLKVCRELKPFQSVLEEGLTL